MTVTQLLITEFTRSGQLAYCPPYTEFYGNPTNCVSLVANIRSQTDGQMEKRSFHIKRLYSIITPINLLHEEQILLEKFISPQSRNSSHFVETKCLSPCHKSPPLVQIYPVHGVPFRLFNMILSSTPRSSK